MPEHHDNAILAGHELIGFFLINRPPANSDHQKRDDAANCPANKGIAKWRSYQFFYHQIIEVCKSLAREGKRVVVAGLEKDYKTIPFGPMPELLIDAEYVTKVNAICMQCGDPANFSQRISNEKNQVVLGEIDKYEARCRKCFQI